MRMCHIFEEERCPYFAIGLIEKVVIYDFKDRRDYLSGIVLITMYICLRYQTTIYQNIRDFFP